MEGAAFSQGLLTPENLEKEKDWAKKMEQVKDYLEKEVDFTIIADIIGDLLKRVYPEVSQESLKSFLQQVSQPSIEVFYEEGVYKNEDPETDKIIFARAGGGRFYFYARPFFATGKFDTVAALHFAIHESLHLASSTFEHLENYSLRSGISTYNEEKGRPVKAFNSLNEGLTELIADSVYSEYLARTGETMKEAYQAVDDESGIPYGSIGTHVTYENERLNVLDLIDSLQEATELPVEDVVRSFVAEYFTGGGLKRTGLLAMYGDYPEIKEIIERQARNLVSGYTKESHEFLVEELPYMERVFIKALFGRDAVGAYNEKVRKEL